MGVENFLLSSTLLGVLAQRLVRVICPNCKRPVNPEDKLIKTMNMSSDETDEIQFFEGEGCRECHHTGYKGRVGIFEYLSVNDNIRKEIMADSDADRIKQVATENGLVTLRQDGWRKVKNGITTIREVLRVTAEG
jgi:general secretion pathway protein E